VLHHAGVIAYRHVFLSRSITSPTGECTDRAKESLVGPERPRGYSKEAFPRRDRFLRKPSQQSGESKDWHRPFQTSPDYKSLEMRSLFCNSAIQKSSNCHIILLHILLPLGSKSPPYSKSIFSRSTQTQDDSNFPRLRPKRNVSTRCASSHAEPCDT
jgi:hypothetical protein